VKALPPGARGYAWSPSGGHGGALRVGGGRVAEAGHANRARWGNHGGRRVWRSLPPWRAVPRAPLEQSSRGSGPGTAPREAVGGPCQYIGPHEGGVGR